MYGYLVKEFGGTEVMKLCELPDPKPSRGQVLMEIKASGVNFAETRMRAGEYSGQPLPFVMGMEGAGVVLEVGEGVVGYSLGDRVFARVRGTHAEKVVVDVEHLMPLPDNLTFEQGAAIPVGWQTAWHAMRTVANFKPGENVLIEAVASSVGSAALQIAKVNGCWVAGTASRDDKLQHALEYGADMLINYKNGNFSEEVLSATRGHGVDVGLMTIGQETATSLLDSMGMDGRVAMYGSTGGRDVTFSLNMGVRNVQLLSMSISTSPHFMPETMESFRGEVIPRFSAGHYKPVIAEVLPMSELALAHELINTREHYGKIILSNQ